VFEELPRSSVNLSFIQQIFFEVCEGIAQKHNCKARYNFGPMSYTLQLGDNDYTGMLSQVGYRVRESLSQTKYLGQSRITA
jgi:hypothetical protein